MAGINGNNNARQSWVPKPSPPAGGVRILSEAYARFDGCWGDDAYGILIVAESEDPLSRVVVLHGCSGSRAMDDWARRIAEGISNIPICEGFRFRRPLLASSHSQTFAYAYVQWAVLMRDCGIDNVYTVQIKDGSPGLNLNYHRNREEGFKTLCEIFGRCRHCGGGGHKAVNKIGAITCRKPAFTAFGQPMGL